MCRSPAGTALLDLLLAIGLVGGFLVAVGPVAARTALTLHRGRALLEGTHLALRGRELWSLQPWGLCPGIGAGRDSGKFAVVNWTAVARPGGVEFQAVIEDHARRFPPETLATVAPCPP